MKKILSLCVVLAASVGCSRFDREPVTIEVLDVKDAKFHTGTTDRAVFEVELKDGTTRWFNLSSNDMSRFRFRHNATNEVSHRGGVLLSVTPQEASAPAAPAHDAPAPPPTVAMPIPKSPH